MKNFKDLVALYTHTTLIKVGVSFSYSKLKIRQDRYTK